MALRHRMIGRAARLWWRVRRPRTFGVRGVVIDASGRIALVRHHYADADLWYLPGGGVERNESAADALIRELREEIALTDLRVDRVLGVYHSRREYKDDHIVVFVVHAGARSDPLRNADEAEIAEASWFALDALPATVSPATARRIGEYCEGTATSGAW